MSGWSKKTSVEKHPGNKRMEKNVGSFWEHFGELRLRLIYTVLFFSVVFLLLWFVRNDLLNIYLAPLHGLMQKVSGEIVLLKIMDKFFIHLKTCLFFTTIISLPFVILQIWGFVAPGLYAGEKKTVGLLMVFVLLFFYLGLCLSYFFIIPFGFEFLVNYSAQEMGVFSSLILPTRLTISLSEQVGFTQKFLLLFGFIFQTPLVMAILVKAGFLSVKTLSFYRRNIIFLCFIVAAILTPPDPITMVGMGVPLVILYELGLVFCRLIEKKGNQQ